MSLMLLVLAMKTARDSIKATSITTAYSTNTVDLSNPWESLPSLVR